MVNSQDGFDKWYLNMVQSFSSIGSLESLEKYDELRARCIGFEKDNPPVVSYLFMIDYTRMKYFYISDGIIDFMGLDREKVYSEPISYTLSNLHPDYMKICFNVLYPDLIKFLQRQEPDVRKQIRVSYNFKVKHKNGEYLPFVQRVNSLEFNADGTPMFDFGALTLDHQYSGDDRIILYVDVLDKDKIYQNLLKKEYFLNDAPSIDFTGRELEIISLIRDGYSSKEIAGQLFLSEHTVKNHKRRIFEKAGVNKVTELLESLKVK